jgi:hypothetical protein
MVSSKVIDCPSGAELFETLASASSFEQAYELWLAKHRVLVDIVRESREQIPLLGFHGTHKDAVDKLTAAKPLTRDQHFAGDVAYIHELSSEDEVIVGNLYSMASKAAFYAFCSSHAASSGKGGVFFFDVGPESRFVHGIGGSMMFTGQAYHRSQSFSQLACDPEEIAQLCFAFNAVMPDLWAMSYSGRKNPEYTWRGALRLGLERFEEKRGFYSAAHAGPLLIESATLPNHIWPDLKARFWAQHIVQHALDAVLNR